MNVADIYHGSDGAATRQLYAALRRRDLGAIAEALFRAQKCSERAKKYHGGIPGKGSYRDLAYERKNWSLSELCKALVGSSIRYGWKEDPQQPFHRHVLYADLPTGQVSFHSSERGDGPEYPGEWDGQRGVSPARIIDFCEKVLAGDQRLFS